MYHKILIFIYLLFVMRDEAKVTLLPCRILLSRVVGLGQDGHVKWRQVQVEFGN